MTTDPVLDLDRLLRPIDDGRSCGEDVRDDAAAARAFDALHDARSAARASERQALAGEDGAARPDWNGVERQAVELLADRGKDLEVAAYLVEALVRRHGLAGLRDGLRLLAGLLERF